MSGDASKPSSAAETAERVRMREEMEIWRENLGEAFQRPDRGEIAEAQVKWRKGGPPDYTKADYVFLKGKTQAHQAGE